MTVIDSVFCLGHVVRVRVS